MGARKAGVNAITVHPMSSRKRATSGSNPSFTPRIAPSMATEGKGAPARSENDGAPDLDRERRGCARHEALEAGACGRRRRVSAPFDGAEGERSTTEDGRDQFTVRPTSESSKVSLSMAVSGSFVFAKFGGVVIIAIVLAILAVGTPIALLGLRGRKRKLAKGK